MLSATTSVPIVLPSTYEVGIGLLPKGLFALPEQVIEEGSDAVGECVGVQVITERIVPVG